MYKKNILPYIYIVLVLLFLYIPMACVVAYSFNASKSTIVWEGFTLDWYVKMLQDTNLIGSLYVSLQVAALSSVVSIAVASLGAVSVNRLAPKARVAVNALIYVPLILPEVVLAVALLAFFSSSPLSFGKTTLVLSHCTFCIPYIYIMVMIRLRNIDPAIFEAARDLGAKRGRVFMTITLPLALPAIVSGGLLAFAMSLDDVAISAFVSGPKSATMPVQVFSMLKVGVTPKINALSSVILFATFLAVGISQFATRKKNEGDGIF